MCHFPTDNPSRILQPPQQIWLKLLVSMAAPSCNSLLKFFRSAWKRLRSWFHCIPSHIVTIFNIYIIYYLLYIYNWGVYHPQLVINQPSLRSSSFRGLIQFRHAASAMMCNLGHGALSKKRVLDGLSIPPIFSKNGTYGDTKELDLPSGNST